MRPVSSAGRQMFFLSCSIGIPKQVIACWQMLAWFVRMRYVGPCRQQRNVSSRYSYARQLPHLKISLFTNRIPSLFRSPSIWVRLLLKVVGSGSDYMLRTSRYRYRHTLTHLHTHTVVRDTPVKTCIYVPVLFINSWP